MAARGPKVERGQCRMKKFQRDELKRALANNPNLDKQEMARLAEELELDLFSVKNWFRRRSV